MLKLILSDLRLWATGWPCLWSRKPHGAGPHKVSIHYKAGWGPWSFALLYATTYLAGTLAGFGVVSLSRAWYYRSGALPRGRYRFACFMTRLLDWLVPGKHGAHTGGWLWNTASRRPMIH